MRETLFVTGFVNATPGGERAIEFARACQRVNEGAVSTVYILGSLFAQGVPKDDMIVFLERLPGRVVLVDPQGDREWQCGAWYGAAEELKVSHWGRTFRLAVDPAAHTEDQGLLIHAGRRVDSKICIRSLWDDWHDQFGPAGLNGLYALSVLAAQIGAGMVAAEPAD